MTVTMVIVDDDPGFRGVAAAMFASLGVEVMEQSDDCLSGLDAIRQNQPDWVLLDVNLPGRDGFSIARQLRDELSPSSILLTSTGTSLWSDAELAEAGVRIYVEKDGLFDPRVVDLVLHETHA